MTTPVAPPDADWTEHATDTIDAVVGLVRDKATVPLRTIARALVYGIALAAPVSVTIGGQPATVLYAGAAPFLISGVVQVNAIVPQGIGSGPQPVVLTIGANSNAGQQVTVAVQ